MCGPHFCSMRHTGCRDYAVQKQLDEQAALEAGMREKSESLSRAERKYTAGSGIGD